MRVLHVSSSLDAVSGGTAIALQGLAKAQTSAGMDVSVVATWQSTSGEPAAEELRQSGIKARVIGKAHGRLSNHPDLIPIVTEMVKQADVVHIHALWEEIQHQAGWVARELGVPYVFSPHGMLDPWSLEQGRWKKKLYMMWRLRKDLNHAAAIHFTSERERDLADVLQLRSATKFVEPLGIDLTEFQKLPETRGLFVQKFPELKDKRLLLFLSRLHHKKGLDLLIPAFAQSAPPDWAMVIAGPDEGYLQIARQLARHHAIDARVVFPGMLYGADRLAALADAALYVLPSYQENFGISVVEALAAGKPVIISDQVNIHPFISAARVGAVVPALLEPLSTALREWMNNQPLRDQAASRAVQLVQEKFDWRVIAQHWQTHYRQIVEQQKGSA